jgi:hypothetical protein
MKRVISGVLAMLVVLPALEISSGINGRDTPLALGGLHMLHSQAITGGSSSQAFNSSLLVRRHARAGSGSRPCAGVSAANGCMQLLHTGTQHMPAACVLLSRLFTVCIPR